MSVGDPAGLGERVDAGAPLGLRERDLDGERVQMQNEALQQRAQALVRARGEARLDRCRQVVSAG
jgi:hypothetical protein